MASFAEAYGFTPKEFFSLTLPQISHYGEYARRQSEKIKNDGSSSSSSSSSSGGSKSVSSLDEFVARYGEQAAKPKTAGE
jgi:hypothetical protein